MAVGTGAISLDEVRIEIGLSSTASLQDCVDNATGTFDPTYYTAPATSLAEFRGYSHGGAARQLVSLSVDGSSGSTACTDWTDPLTRNDYYIPNGETWDGTAPSDFFTAVTGSTHPASGYYSNGTTWRIWNGTSWSGVGAC
jgi:hypothetical protein